MKVSAIQFALIAKWVAGQAAGEVSGEEAAKPTTSMIPIEAIGIMDAGVFERNEVENENRSIAHIAQSTSGLLADLPAE